MEKEKYDIFDKLIFEGEYLNGKRNGKGREYNNGFLNFEGTYLNGERNGNEIEYNYINKSKFEGEYLNSKKYGKRKNI